MYNFDQNTARQSHSTAPKSKSQSNAIDINWWPLFCVAKRFGFQTALLLEWNIQRATLKSR